MAINRDAADYLYVQLASHIRAQIVSGVLPPGTRLPPLKQLSAAYDLAEMTVRKALRMLVDEGLVITRPGRGVFVA